MIIWVTPFIPLQDKHINNEQQIIKKYLLTNWQQNQAFNKVAN